MHDKLFLLDGVLVQGSANLKLKMSQQNAESVSVTTDPKRVDHARLKFLERKAQALDPECNLFYEKEEEEKPPSGNSVAISEDLEVIIKVVNSEDPSEAG